MHLALQLLAWLLTLAWLAKLIESAIGFPKIPNLTLPAFDRPPAGSPTLTVIVPARNEAPNIAATLHSLLAQDYPHLRILAIDDRSTDATGAIMNSLAAAEPTRLEVLRITTLPAGWLGKTHAMSLAAQYAIANHHPDFLLFTDADILFHPESLRRSLAQAVATQAAHFITLPTTLTKTPGEAMILSFLQVVSLWAVRPWRVADPRARDAIGVGAFNLIRTEAYLQLGGFEATPMEIVEDLTLGRRVKAAGLPQRVAMAPGWVAVHWAPGLLGIINGLTKNTFAAFQFRPAFLLAAALSLTLFCLSPFVFLITPGFRLPGALAFASIAGLYLLSSRRSGISPWNAVYFPLAAAFFAWSMLRSMFITLKDGGVTWRGTFYPLATLRRAPQNPVNPPIPPKSP